MNIHSQEDQRQFNLFVGSYKIQLTPPKQINVVDSRSWIPYCIALSSHILVKLHICVKCSYFTYILARIIYLIVQNNTGCIIFSFSFQFIFLIFRNLKFILTLVAGEHFSYQVLTLSQIHSSLIFLSVCYLYFALSV